MSGRILTPFIHRVSPGPLRAPNGYSQIDWSHPLARGLRGCWMPGLTYNDLTNKTNPLTPQSGIDDRGGTQEGIGIISTAANSGAYITVGTGGDYTSWSELTLYWRGSNIGAPPAYSSLLGISYSNTDIAPYVVANLQADGTGANWVFDWNSNGSVVDSFGSFSLTRVAGALSFGATAIVNGVCTGYSNGVSLGTKNFGAIGPTSSANSTLCINGWVPVTTRNPNGICIIAAIWTRALTAYEMAWLHREPYSFLLPAETEMPVIFLPTAPSVLFRKSASRIGTRTGTRQTWAG